jgi:hypothetical protein
MDRVEEELTPAQEWQQNLNATINRLSTQYVNLLRAASSAAAVEKQDPRGTYAVVVTVDGFLVSFFSFTFVPQLVAEKCKLPRMPRPPLLLPVPTCPPWSVNWPLKIYASLHLS